MTVLILMIRSLRIVRIINIRVAIYKDLVCYSCYDCATIAVKSLRIRPPTTQEAVRRARDVWVGGWARNWAKIVVLFCRAAAGHGGESQPQSQKGGVAKRRHRGG